MSYIVEYVIQWCLVAYMMVKQWRIYLVTFSCGPTVNRWNRRTQTLTHMHTPAYTHSDEYNKRECNALQFATKIRLMVNTPGNILAKGNQHLYLTPLDIVAIAIAHPPRIHRNRGYKPDLSSILYTFSIFHSNIWPWNGRSITSTISMKIRRSTYLWNCQCTLSE